MDEIPVFVWRSTESARRPQAGLCIYCQFSMHSDTSGKIDSRTVAHLQQEQKDKYGALLQDLTPTDWQRLKPHYQKLAENWDMSVDSLDALAEWFNLFNHPVRQCCSRCGWWTAGINSNNGAGFSLTASAALLEFDLRSADLTVPEISSHLTRKFSDVYSVSPRQFEQVVADIYGNIGWKVVLTKQSRDGGVDLCCVASESVVPQLASVAARRSPQR